MCALLLSDSGKIASRLAASPPFARKLVAMALPTISLGTLLKRIVQAVLAVQGATLLALGIVDYRRKKLRKPATFPRLPPRSVTAGSSEVTVYTYGEDLYRDMLERLSTSFAATQAEATRTMAA